MPAQIRRMSKKYLTRPGRDHRQEQDDHVGQHHPALPDGVSYPQKVDALTRILEVENFEGMIVFVRTKNETETLAEKLRARGFSAQAINGDVAQIAARADGQPAQGRQARHPGRHRRRRPRSRRRADQPRRQLRHPHRHRVLRAPDRPHRPGRPQRRRDLVRHPARALPAQAHREGHPAAADADAAADRRGRQRHPAGPLRRRRSPRRSTQTGRIERSATSSPTTCSEHDVPEADVAAALAVVAQGDTPLLLEPEPSARRGASATSAATATADRGDRPRRGARRTSRWRRTGSWSASGTRSSRARSSARSPTRVACAATTSAHISIRPDHSLVELPAELPGQGLEGARADPDQRQADRAAARLRPAVRVGPPKAKKPRHKKSQARTAASARCPS